MYYGAIAEGVIDGKSIIDGGDLPDPYILIA